MAKKKALSDGDTKAEITSQAASPVLDGGAEYTVLARRYRPQQFTDLAGQEAVTQALSNAIKTNRVAHAYLFTGARGVGKTSTARILAKCLNCETGPTIAPCDRCERCRMIASGEDTDVLEIDGASNNGVDAVRDLRANVQYRPQRSRYKIYIIDEVHMLSTAAFNALLKTLEEPPPHVKFIFATTEANKIPITILSRCQRFDFSGMNLPTLRDRLKHIVASEGMEADDEAIELIARRAAGSMRDGQSLLDQLLSFGSGRLTAQRVHDLLGTANEDRVVEIATAVLGKDAKKALSLLDDFIHHGQQLGELLDQLIEYWRDLMVVHAAGVEDQSLSISNAQKPIVQKQAQAMDLDTILAGMDVLVSAKQRMRFTAYGRVVMEMALVRLARLDSLVPLSQLAQWVQEGGAASIVSRPSGAVLSSAGGRVSEVQEKKKLIAENPRPASNGHAAAVARLHDGNLQAVWQQLLSEAGFATGSDLRRAINIAISGPNALVLTFPARYNLREEQLLEPTRKTQVEELLYKLTGQAWQVRVAISPHTTGNLPGAPAAETDGNAQRRMREEMLKKPLIHRAVDLLGAQIVQIEPGFGTHRESGAVHAVNSEEEDDLGNQDSEE
jgi:DNA polymerase-3 subunit gamma/tau